MFIAMRRLTFLLSVVPVSFPLMGKETGRGDLISLSHPYLDLPPSRGKK
jgi:hypothetical protein